MAENEHYTPPSQELLRAAVGQYERAQQVISSGDFDYAINLLQTCCKLDPANLIYRRLLRQVEKSKYQNNMRGSRMAMLTTSPSRARLKAAKRSGDHLKVMEYAEDVLSHNPWDTGVQLDQGAAAAAAGLLDVGVWTLEQARQKDPKDVKVNRALARLYEKRGNFTQAITLWEMVREAVPTDIEARSKSKDLAANDTIARGQYEQALGEQSPRPGSGEGAGPVKSTIHAAHPVRDRVAREAEPLRARLAADPTTASGYLHLAALYRRGEMIDEARAVLKEGLGPTGNHFDLCAALADLDIEHFRRDLQHTEERLRQGDSEELKQIRSQLRKEIDTRELDLFRQKAERYPGDHLNHFELGVRLLRVGQADEAIRELQPLRNDTRYQWKALMYLGYCFRHRHNWRLAQRNFEEALELMPPIEETARKDILYQLARGCAESGDFEKAVDYGHDLANIDFGYRDIARLLEDWQTRRAQG